MSSNTEHAALMEARKVFRNAAARYMKRRTDLLLNSSDLVLAQLGVTRSEVIEAIRGLPQPTEKPAPGKP